ncbi:RNA-binding protein [Bryobacterales bacterium F-183]|nr:RNA-binding protein [Bryobacterales bacterium F-183]
MNTLVRNLVFCAVCWSFNVKAQGVATHNAIAEKRSAFSGIPWTSKLVDTARTAGLRSPVIAGGEKTKRYIIEANGSGVALLDFDNDGFLDVFLVNGSRLDTPPVDATNKLYRNSQKGLFEDVSVAAGVAQKGWGSGVCAGDYDNDGFTDLFVTYWGPNVLLRNTGKGKFVDASKAVPAAGAKDWSSGCTFVDYDRDGLLDLFVTSYQKFDLATAPLPGKTSNCEWKGMPVFCGPRGLPYGKVSLYRNKGDGTFADVTASSKIGDAQGFYAFTAVAADLNEDGWPDLYVASDSTPSLFFRNQKDGTFAEIGAEAGVAFNEHGFEQGGMGIALADCNGDGHLDVFKTNFAGDHPNLYLNRGKGVFEDGVLRAGLGVNPQYVGWGVGFVDLDNDGLIDVFQANGHVYPELETAKSSEEYRNPRLVYRNLGGCRFEDVSHLAGAAVAEKHSSRGVAFGDIDNDGDVDVLIMNMNEPPTLLRNDVSNKNGWLRVKLQGTKSNRSAIGAEVTVGKQKLVVMSQTSFLSHNDLRLHFGLGTQAESGVIRVRWPSGETQEFASVKANQEIVLVEK